MAENTPSLMQELDALEARMNAIPVRSREFARDLIRQGRTRGSLSPKQLHWVRKLQQESPEGSEDETIDASKIYELMHRARGRLKYPKITLTMGGTTVRFQIAGDRARYPGSINVTDGGSFQQATWYGRILQDGTWQKRSVPPNVAQTVRWFAQNPERMAAEYGRESGNCCFCSLPLTDERSVEVGYGPVCAGNYGLPWGNRRQGEAA